MAKPRIPRKNRIAKPDPRRLLCIACNGSGVYDHNGTPPCGSCNGTGMKSGY